MAFFSARYYQRYSELKLESGDFTEGNVHHTFHLNSNLLLVSNQLLFSLQRALFIEENLQDSRFERSDFTEDNDAIYSNEYSTTILTYPQFCSANLTRTAVSENITIIDHQHIIRLISIYFSIFSLQPILFSEENLQLIAKSTVCSISVPFFSACHYQRWPGRN